MNTHKSSVSVCIAVYNGELFIEEQIQSILCQLRVDDELILVNDASPDSSMKIASTINDHRIKIINMDKNRGHISAFETGIKAALGEIIFLADQDDIWYPEKIVTVLQYFESNSEVAYVYHNLRRVDEVGVPLLGNFPTHRARNWYSLPFLLSHFVRPQIFGCGSAFSRRVLPIALPFPAEVYAHEHWLATCSSMVGRVQFISEVLVDYRQHGSNQSPKARLPVLKSLRMRIMLLTLLIKALIMRIKHTKNIANRSSS
ncbi:MAG: glycosyltransferase [Desulfuromonadales bacterium]